MAETISFAIEIPIEQAEVFISALAARFGGYKPKLITGVINGVNVLTDNPETINEFVRRKQIEEWQRIINSFELDQLKNNAQLSKLDIK